MTEEVEVENGESGRDHAIENEADLEAVVTKITDAAGSYKTRATISSIFLSPVIYGLSQVAKSHRFSFLFLPLVTPQIKSKR